MMSLCFQALVGLLSVMLKIIMNMPIRTFVQTAQ